MNNLIKSILSFSLKNRFFVFFMVSALVAGAVIVAAMRREAAAISVRSVRAPGSRKGPPRSRSRSADPWIAVSGVRSSAVSRCSERIADDTLSSRVSRVAGKHP